MGYGQFSYHSRGKRTKADLLRTVTPGYQRAQLWGNNRLFVVYPDRVEYRLHDTSVVTRYDNGTVRIDDGGWETLTTTAAIRQALILAYGKVCNCWRDRKGFFVMIGNFEKTAELPFEVTHAERLRVRPSGDYTQTVNRMIEDACEAEERFGLDELERFAAERKA